MKIIIDQSERGLVFKNGIYQRMIFPGKHYFFGRSWEVKQFSICSEFSIPGFPIEIFLADETLKKELVVLDVLDEKIAFHFVDGRFQDCFKSGKYAFWNAYGEHTFQLYDTSCITVQENFPKYLFRYLSETLYQKVEVAAYQKARLYFDQKLITLLEEGTYYFWNNSTKVEAELVDTRLLQMDITGQEILSLDKVSLRINFVCQYRIVDYIKVRTEIENVEEQIHILIQMALRQFVGKFKLDEILNNKDEISDFVLQVLKEKQKDYYVEFFDAGVKDIILPGEIRAIMNTVLLAEKQAQANVITRREEVASTRSLLNTARLMDENRTLYQLKELEYLEKICENVGNITINGGTDLLKQLTEIFRSQPFS